MKVLVVLPYPFSDHQLSGGAQSTMQGQMSALRQLGFEFRILCTKNLRSVPGPTEFEIRSELTEFSVVAPDPAAFASNLPVMIDALAGVDLVWTLDRAFPLIITQPILMSYSTLGIYPDESICLFDTNWDGLLVFSKYSLDKVASWLPHHAAMVRPPRVEIVAPGIDAELWKHWDRDWLREWLGHTASFKYVLFPHRPEAGKGHRHALDVIANLVTRDPRYHLLIPEPPVGSAFEESAENEFILSLKAQVSTEGLADHVTFHPWISRTNRGRYYASGTVCLYLSTLPETFGLSAVEAVAAGTPVISLGAGALSEAIPPGRAHIITTDQSAAGIAQRISDGLPDADAIAEDRAYLAEVCSLPSLAERISNIMRTLTKADRRQIGKGV